ncbi:aromatase/cyclase [Kitasatospora sp. NBC_00458]|uniref:aromatase/cyclase n=1 Tax=Kitasatospora sp. NBC_00458 TaxID=2903568 RepID=UPI002E19C443
MTDPVVRTARHSVDIAADPRLVHRLLAEATDWPELFPPTVHVERTALDPHRELLAIWALAGQEVKSWTSERTIDPDRLTIDFVRRLSTPPVAAMSGRWEITGRPDGGARVVLDHRFSAVDDDPEQLDWIEEATDRNSASELAALRGIAEGHARHADLRREFTDSVLIRATPEEVYGYLDRADLWPARLPHVARVELTEERPGEQVLEMDSRSPNGSVHTTRSVRIGRPPALLAYKQTVLPAAFTVHTGSWTLTAEPGPGPVVTRATARHTVVLHPAEALALPGVSSLDEAHAVVRRALGGNSLTTLNAAKDHLERATAAH